MSRQFLLPDLGEGLTEAEIVSWLVAPGDTVSIDQPVVEVESAKSVVELPCPFDGVIESLDAMPGQNVHAGQPLLTVSGAGRSPEAPDVVPDTAVRGLPETGTRRDAAEDERTDKAAGDDGSGAVLIGYGTSARKRGKSMAGSGRFGSRGAATPAAPATAGSSGNGTGAGTAVASATRTDRRSPVVSPIVRKLAAAHGFNASDLAGSGSGSLVLRADVEAHIARLEAESSLGTTAESGDLRIPITGIRKLVADRLSASRREIPEATIWLDVDATALLAAKDALQRATGERFSVTALIARFVVAALRRYPILNSSVDLAAGDIVQHGAINLGIAAQTPRGLMVPVVHDAQDLTTAQLRDRIGELVEAAGTGSFPPGKLTGGTFTFNNYGGFGVDGSAAIINLPEAAILGIGRIIDRPWVVDGEIVVRKVGVLSLVFDHRVCDGDIPSQFIGYIARCIENPVSLLADL